MYARSPLGALPGPFVADTAAAGLGGVYPAGPAGTVWWQTAQKKRKRTVSCGRCAACCREDCGRCLNCTDKPKFGGLGIRKQSCLERKCLNASVASASAAAACRPLAPAATTAAAAATPTAPSLMMPKVLETVVQAKTGLIPPHEWHAFWSAVEGCMRLQDADNNGVSADERGAAGGKKARLARCGECSGCTRGDCGECKNCRDKPKYGGPGVKKQACLCRVCSNPVAESVAAAVEAETPSTEGFLSSEASPALRPTPGATAAPEPLELGPRVALPADGDEAGAPMEAAEAAAEEEEEEGEEEATAEEEEEEEDEREAAVPSGEGGVNSMMLATRQRLSQLREQAGSAASSPWSDDDVDGATAYSTADDVECEQAAGM